MSPLYSDCEEWEWNNSDRLEKSKILKYSGEGLKIGQQITLVWEGKDEKFFKF